MMKLINIIKRFCTLLYIYYSIWSDLRKQKFFLKKYFSGLLKKIHLKNDGSIDEEDIKKMYSFYGLGLPAILGESFCSLRAYKMTNNERECSTLSGAVTGLFDDLFDKKRTDNTLIKQMLDTPESVIATNDNQKLLLELYKILLNKLTNKELTKQYIYNIYEVQVDTLSQENKNIKEDEIIEITYKKGGYSVLFFRTLYEHNLDENEIDALYNLGALMQLGDDIFDVYKDYNSGIHTLATRTDNINVLRKYFIDQHIRTNNLFKKLDYSKKDIDYFLNKVLAILSRCYVCLDQFEKLQKNTNNKFDPSKYSRKELICDMEKPVNILRSIKYYIKNDI